MTQLPLGRADYDRQYGRMPPAELVNRFFEQDPTNAETSAALLSRCGSDQLSAFGAGPIRKIWSQEGSADGALFVVSGPTLFRYDKDGTKTALVGIIAGTATPEMDGTRDFVFLTDGTNLIYYNGVGSFATGKLTFTGLAIDTQTVTLGGVTYTFVPAVSVANDVRIGATAAECVENLVAAINAVTGTGEGTLYGAGTDPNPSASATQNETVPEELDAVALAAGTVGNAVVTTETLTNASWGAATLTGGVAQGLNAITTPDDVGIVSLAVLGGFVLCAAAQSDRVYFIRPPVNPDDPENPEIDPLDFFTAESHPDELINIRVIGDEAWLFGVASTEVWYLSGVGAVPFDRVKGRAFSKGVLAGTPVIVNNTVFLVGEDGVVYKTGGGLQRISTHAIEQKVREARKAERENA